MHAEDSVERVDVGAMRLVEGRLRAGKPVAPQLLAMYERWKHYVEHIEAAGSEATVEPADEVPAENQRASSLPKRRETVNESSKLGAAQSPSLRDLLCPGSWFARPHKDCAALGFAATKSNIPAVKRRQRRWAK